VSLNEEVVSDIDNIPPVGSVASSLSPLEQVLSVTDFISYFEKIGELAIWMLKYVM